LARELVVPQRAHSHLAQYKAICGEAKGKRERRKMRRRPPFLFSRKTVQISSFPPTPPQKWRLFAFDRRSFIGTSGHLKLGTFYISRTRQLVCVGHLRASNKGALMQRQHHSISVSNSYCCFDLWQHEQWRRVLRFWSGGRGRVFHSPCTLHAISNDFSNSTLAARLMLSFGLRFEATSRGKLS